MAIRKGDTIGPTTSAKMFLFSTSMIIAGFSFYIIMSGFDVFVLFITIVLFGFSFFLFSMIFTTKIIMHDDSFIVVSIGLKGLIGKSKSFKYKSINTLTINRTTPLYPKKDNIINVSWRDRLIINDGLILSGVGYDNLERLIIKIMQNNSKVIVRITNNTFRDNFEENISYNAQRAVLEILKK